MPRNSRQVVMASLVVLSVLCLSVKAHDPAEDLAKAASAWLQSLDAPQRARAAFPFEDSERENWYYVPIARKGIPLREMTETQRALARKLITAGLSHRGLLQADAIIALENVLATTEGSASRNPLLYYFTLFGTPNATGSWGWRVEGHHLSINFTLVHGKVSATPFFFGSNPAEVRIDHEQKGRRALAQEEDLGRTLMKSFSEDQRRIVLIADKAPREIITGNDRQVKPSDPAGLAYLRMSPDQKQQLRELVKVYADRVRTEIAKIEMQKIADRGWDNLHFAWAGGLERGEGHYYRIQGPAFVIEYDNTQNGANHIHTTWRNFDGDFGRDLLRDHYQRDHSVEK